MVFLIASPSAKRLLCHLLELERSREGKAGCLGKEQSKELFIRSDLSVFHAGDLVEALRHDAQLVWITCGQLSGILALFHL